MEEIRFGTDGWRHVISDGFTFANVRRVAQAIAEDLLARGHQGRRVVVGYDTRFLSPRYAQLVAEVLAGNGLEVLLTREAAPTPAVSWAVREKGAAGGVMVTASHNPPEYNGLKFKGPYGGSALPELTSAVERHLAEETPIRFLPLEQALAQGRVRLFDPKPGYFAQLRRLVDLSVFTGLNFTVVADPMHGAGRGYLKELLAPTGLKVVEIRGEHNPGFGGVNPEPIERNLTPLFEAVGGLGAALGLATDGDADRVGAVDEQGHFVDSHRIFALLFRHLVNTRGWDGAVVKTFSTTRMIDLLARRLGKKLHVTPIGFKYICRLMLEDDVLIGGEESGGIGIKYHLPERDGILSGLLLLEIMALSGRKMSELVADLLQEVGPHYYRRVDLEIREAQTLMRRLAERPPKEIAGRRVRGQDGLDGQKFLLEDESWILFRASGTEPVVRIYAEAASPQAAEHLLAAGARYLAEGEVGRVAGGG
ncbi:MAG: phosphoglucomutase/phosphomannomutase family protein [Clostridia bacterium]|jgi:alpha-D-glucose phosphate-specific phosphoglucomutase|nr:phosphoglucomutase/phosphomannomutase family protein [Clostridia bacterium]MDH7571969.1 phosphoglucomutase/phosphomannomutase family protein [Clostridia bacterium]